MENLQLELFRLAPSGVVSLTSVETGSGNLKCGTYQFAYRLINEVTGKSTKFSLFTNPIAINSKSKTGDMYGPINTYSNKSIVINVQCNDRELLEYEAVQIAVIENTVGAMSNSLEVSLISAFPIIGVNNSFTYASNERITAIDLTEIAVDDAPIKTFKTMAIKNNRMIGGNIIYKDLKFDNGDPVVSSGEIITRETPMVGSPDKAKSESRGYFSDEVYRFYISFWDIYGDYSLPKALDMTNVDGNTIEKLGGGFYDMKFPKRDSNNKFLSRTATLVDAKAVNKGLRLTVNNIPSWAKGAVILRAKRKKNILFQSPIIPTTIVQPPDANTAFSYPGENRTVPNPLGTLAPKNMALPLNKAILRSESGQFKTVDWEANHDSFEYVQKVHMAFPPEVIFNNSGVPYMDYVKNGNLSIQNVDYCRVSAVNLNNFNDREHTSGDRRSNDGKWSASATIAASVTGYASNEKTRSQMDSEFESIERPLQDEVPSFSLVPNNVDSFPVIGISSKDAPTSMFGAYKDLEISPNGAYNGFTPNIQKTVIFSTKQKRKDLSYYAVNGSKAGYDTTSTLSVNGQQISPISIPDVTGENSNPISVASSSFIEIVNFTAGLNDDRYGKPDNDQDIVSTGTVVPFEQAPSSITVDVFGGDCYISPFTFNVHDSHYGVINSANWGDDGEKWNRSPFKDDSDVQLRRPFPYRALNVNIGVYLESEVNGLCIEEFLTIGQTSTVDITQDVTIEDFTGTVTYGNIYRSGNNYYRSLINSTTAAWPRASLNVNEKVVSNVGYLYEDLGSSINSKFYRYKQSDDNFITTNTHTEARQNFSYLYNPEYSFENRAKPFPFVKKDIDFNRTNFSSRLIYSDVKILQTNLDGFSRFRVANIYDLEESKGSVTGLVDFGGRIFAVQRRAFCYVPIDAQIIETADSSQMAIQSGAVIGYPQYIENFGSSHIRSIQSTPTGLVFFDITNSKLIVYGGSTGFVNDLGISKYIEEVSDSLRHSKISDKDAQTYYDYNRNETIFKFGNKGVIHDASLGVVKGYLKPNAQWDYGNYFNSAHILFGKNGNDLIATHINSNEANHNMLGVPFVSNLRFLVNEEFFYTKMFYIVKFICSGVEDATIRAISNNGQRSSFAAPTMPDRRAGFLLNHIRDTVDKRRLRGEFAEITTTLTNNELVNAITKFQATHRII
jgi:hypothetical protein